MHYHRPLRSTDVRDVYHQEYFLQRVDGYDQFACFDGTPQTLFNRACRNLELLNVQPGERFLDLGCGRGEVVIAAGYLGAIAVGCDFSYDAIVLARQKLEAIIQNNHREIQASFLCAVDTDDIFRTNTFDKVLMSEFIEHVSPHESAIILKNIKKWLKPVGRLLVYTSPNRWSRHTHPLMRWYVRWRSGIDIGARPADTLHPGYPKLHLNEQSYLSLYVALWRAGFRCVRVWFDSPAPTGRLSIVKRSLLYNALFGGNLTAMGIK
ncbi:methyltransferase domain-containing protein [Chloroflexus aggregans]|uniref:Methyltransferase type 11 n=1 Tax=Chloroflexus aggregans (strain MD-66 / DSM 9485) TaxID=326427 RepID=B8GBP3_CHLAD|nr:methyltransferase domain-containing protein [Chloroflexus aggregans]ACL24860.1 Methyltransferase type 11 [Chloroflexus aggregans DSM 9485]